MAQIACPNCLRPVSADLAITTRGGFSKVYLGIKCNTCGAMFKSGSALWRVIQALTELREVTS